MEESGLPRGKFEVNDAKKAAYKGTQSKSVAPQPAVSELVPKVEVSNPLISYSDLSTGCQLIGAVSAIGREELILNLPFNMIGHCTVANCVSSKSNVTDLFRLKTPFRIGQLVQCVVLETVSSSKHTRVSVSLLPSLVNAGLSESTLPPRGVVSGFVTSEENHGFSVDLGVGFSAFLPKSDTPIPPTLGALIMGSVTSVKNSLVKLSVQPSALTAQLGYDKELKASACRAGQLVSARVRDIRTDGTLEVSFLKHLNGTLHTSYLNGTVKKGGMVTARVIAVLPGNNFRLSNLAHLVEWASLEFPSQEGLVEAKVVDSFKGHFIRLQREDDESSLVCHWSRGGRNAEVGKSVSCRIMGSNQLDRTLLVSCEEKVVKETAVVSVSAVIPGSVFTSEIQRVDKELGVIVKISDFLTGRVPKEHLTDLPAKKLPVSVAVGAKLKVRVLSVDAMKRQILLTAKKGMVSDSEKIIENNSQAIKDDILTGFVAKVSEPQKGIRKVYVNFYGAAFGIAKIPDNEESENIKEGALIKVRVVKVGEKHLKLTTDLDTTKKETNKPSNDLIGTVIDSFRFPEIVSEDTLVEVNLNGGWLSGKVPMGHLADLEISSNRESLKSQITKLVVIGVDKEGLLILSGKASLLEKVAFDSIPDEGAFAVGYVTRVEQKFALISLGPLSKTGICLLGNMSDRFVDDAKKFLIPGQSVVGSILGKGDRKGACFSICLKSSVLMKDHKETIRMLGSSWLKNSLPVDNLGKLVTDAKLKTKKPYGLLFTSVTLPGWTLVAVNDNIPEGFNIEELNRLLVLDVISDKKVLEVMIFDDSSNKRDFTVRLQKDFYLVAACQESVVFVPRSRLDREAGLAIGGSVRVKDNGIVIGNVSIRHLAGKEDLKKSEESKKAEKLVVGQSVLGPLRVVSVGTDYAEVVISGRTARLHATELYPITEWRDSPLAELSKGSEILGSFQVSAVLSRGSIVWLGRESSSLPIETNSVPTDSYLSGIVTSSSLKGVFVSLSRTVSGRIALSRISPRPATEADLLKLYPVGKLVRVKRDGIPENDKLDLIPEDTKISELAALTVGMVVATEVSNKQKFGVFLKVSGTAITALAPLTQKGGITREVLERVQSGQQLLAKITKIENGKVWASLEDSQVALLAEQAKDVSSSSDMEIESDSDDVCEEIIEVPKVIPSTPKTKLIPLSSTAATTPATQSPRDAMEDSSDSDSDEKSSKRLSKKQRLSEKAAKEASVRSKEDRNVAGEWRSNPQSPDDFERLILSEGDKDPSVWTRYMAYWLQLSEIGKARETAERAVKRIGAHLESEKLDVWISYLNMEAAFGTPDNVKAVFVRACQYCESESVHKALPGVWARVEDKAKESAAWEGLVKKFSHSVENWLSYFDRLFGIGEAEAARALVGRAVRLVGKKEEVRVMLKVANLECSHGHIERAKTLFDQLIASNPKRCDIWGVYFDAIKGAFIRSNNSTDGVEVGNKRKRGKPVLQSSECVPIASVRNLFERAICVGLKPHKTKGFFKKWLEFETDFGGELGQLMVKEKAKAYVESLAGMSDNDQEEQ